MPKNKVKIFKILLEVFKSIHKVSDMINIGYEYNDYFEVSLQYRLRLASLLLYAKLTSLLLHLFLSWNS